MVLKTTPKICKKVTSNRKLPDFLRIWLKNVGKIKFSHFSNWQLHDFCPKSDRRRRELPEFGVALHVRFCKLGPSSNQKLPYFWASKTDGKVFQIESSTTFSKKSRSSMHMCVKSIFQVGSSTTFSRFFWILRFQVQSSTTFGPLNPADPSVRHENGTMSVGCYPCPYV